MVVAILFVNISTASGVGTVLSVILISSAQTHI